MTQSSKISQTIFAPAKINLFLHIVGKREDNHHLLQSLVTFADFGDDIKITPAHNFSFSTSGKTENLSDNSDNLVVKAANLLAKELNKPLAVDIHLSKNTPIGAGLGGGSADAAATIKGLLTYWDKDLPNKTIENILLNLGADVPACYKSKPCLIEGIGEIITPLTYLPKIPAVLIYPNEFCSTADVFKNHTQSFSNSIKIPNKFSDQKGFYGFLRQQKNDLTEPACQKFSIIENALKIIQKQKGCQISRMSGSGSACFGLFETSQKSENAAKTIQKEKPDWWVWPALLG